MFSHSQNVDDNITIKDNYLLRTQMRRKVILKFQMIELKVITADMKT